jgi:serine/threonine protein kinase
LKSRGRLPAAEVIELGRALATPLTHLHSHGLVHRDIKPAPV